MHVVLDRSCRPQHEQTLTQEQEHGTLRAHISTRGTRGRGFLSSCSPLLAGQ